MNERIISLLAQAHLEIKEEFGIIDTNQVAERFATLIIKECAELVEYNSKGAGRDIREHFGVK
jgi:hypothetical protein